MSACGLTYPNHLNSGCPWGSLGIPLGHATTWQNNSSAIDSRACMDPCGENIIPPWLVGTGVSKEASAWLRAPLLPCSCAGRSCGCVKDGGPGDQHPSTHLGKGVHRGTDQAHKSHAMPGVEECPASARQCVSLGRSPKRVRPVHLPVCCTTCRAEVRKPWQVCISLQSIATAGGSTSRAGRNITNGALRLLLVWGLFAEAKQD